MSRTDAHTPFWVRDAYYGRIDHDHSRGSCDAVEPTKHDVSADRFRSPFRRHLRECNKIVDVIKHVCVHRKDRPGKGFRDGRWVDADVFCETGHSPIVHDVDGRFTHFFVEKVRDDSRYCFNCERATRYCTPAFDYTLYSWRYSRSQSRFPKGRVRASERKALRDAKYGVHESVDSILSYKEADDSWLWD